MKRKPLCNYNGPRIDNWNLGTRPWQHPMPATKSLSTNIDWIKEAVADGVWIKRIEHRKWNRGCNGLHQLGQPVAPSILFPVFNPLYPQGRVAIIRVSALSSHSQWRISSSRKSWERYEILLISALMLWGVTASALSGDRRHLSMSMGNGLDRLNGSIRRPKFDPSFVKYVNYIGIFMAWTSWMGQPVDPSTKYRPVRVKLTSFETSNHQLTKLERPSEWLDSRIVSA